MKLKEIAFNNLKRRKSKMVFLILSIMIGVATIITILNTTEQAQMDIETKLDEFGANIMIVPKSNTLSMSYGGISIPGAQYDVREISESELKNIWTINDNQNLSIVSAKLLGAVDIESESAMMIGANLATEIRLKKWWQFQEGSEIEMVRSEEPSPIDPTRMMTVTAIKDFKPTDIILGSRVAAKFNKNPGSTVNLKYNNTKGNYYVRGVLEETGSQDDSVIFMDLATAQGMLNKDAKITLVEVAALCAGCPVEEMARQINAALPNGQATPIKQVVASKMQTIGQLKNFGLLLGAIILVIGSFIVFTTMMGSVNERTREIGIFRAIGFRRSHIMKIIFLEAAVVCLVAGLSGFILGTLASFGLSGWISESRFTLMVNPLYAGASMVFAVILGILASIYPAKKAADIDPTEALRHI
ncbi:MAG: ABC transporter permease [Spirochaetales bacterium]|nr:ABC transporter permease [Spirochaetales bacterium]